MAGISNSSLFSSGVGQISAAASDLFAGLYTAPAEAAAATAQSDTAKATADADLLQGQGDILEGEAYTTAASLAGLNAEFTASSTAIQEAQAQRALYMQLGSEKAAAAGSGGTSGGSAGDILRSSASQGALNASVLQQQGLITQAGFQQQQESYTLMSNAAGVASQAEQASATGEDEAASEYDKEASLMKESETGDFISAAISGVAGVASVAMAA